MSRVVYRQAIGSDRDLVEARSRAMMIAGELGFQVREQTQIATALSEIGRNALTYAGRGEIEFALESGRPNLLTMRVSDHGPGMPDPADAQAMPRDGNARGMGLIAARKLMDRFAIESSGGKGTVIVMAKELPRHAVGDVEGLVPLLQKVAKTVPPADPVRTVQDQNRQLLDALTSERERHEELARLNQELEETNRGVVALYSELDEKAEYLRRASDLKSRFLSHMSHEFRTPLSSILALSRLLLDQVDGPLLAEQQKQVTYIRKSAEGLLELINDLLDIAKVEAGKLSVNCTDFSVADMFGGLRGALRPLMTRETVGIDFEEEGELPELHTDEGKVAQILRNFIANAIRFTEEGSIEVAARYHADRDLCEFAVKDTGIGIAPQDQQVIFEEFAQVEGELQHQSRGTGLGLPLSKQLAELLGGHIDLSSEPGRGSVFTLWLPRALQNPAKPVARHAGGRRALVIDDEDTFRYIIRQLLSGIEGLSISEARTGVEGIARARQERPDIVILDVLMPGRGGKEVLRALKAEPELKDIPVLITTSLPLTERLRAELRDATAIVAKQNLSSDSLRSMIASAIGPRPGAGGSDAQEAGNVR
jgi:signal transduction histidine kinase